jgi:hypothetical protein
MRLEGVFRFESKDRIGGIMAGSFRPHHLRTPGIAIYPTTYLCGFSALVDYVNC